MASVHLVLAIFVFPYNRCTHIFAVLGEKETFEKYYREQRKEQAKVLLHAPTKISESLDTHVKFFHEVIG